MTDLERKAADLPAVLTREQIAGMYQAAAGSRSWLYMLVSQLCVSHERLRRDLEAAQVPTDQPVIVQEDDTDGEDTDLWQEDFGGEGG